MLELYQLDFYSPIDRLAEARCCYVHSNRGWLLRGADVGLEPPLVLAGLGMWTHSATEQSVQQRERLQANLEANKEEAKLMKADELSPSLQKPASIPLAHTATFSVEILQGIFASLKRRWL